MQAALEDTAIWIRKKHRKISDASDDDLLAIETAISTEKCEGIGFGAVASDFLIINRNASHRRKRKIGTLLKALINIARDWLCKNETTISPGRSLSFSLALPQEPISAV